MARLDFVGDLPSIKICRAFLIYWPIVDIFMTFSRTRLIWTNFPGIFCILLTHSDWKWDNKLFWPDCDFHYGPKILISVQNFLLQKWDIFTVFDKILSVFDFNNKKFLVKNTNFWLIVANAIWSKIFFVLFSNTMGQKLFV